MINKLSRKFQKPKKLLSRKSRKSLSRKSKKSLSKKPKKLLSRKHRKPRKYRKSLSRKAKILKGGANINQLIGLNNKSFLDLLRGIISKFSQHKTQNPPLTTTLNNTSTTDSKTLKLYINNINVCVYGTDTFTFDNSSNQTSNIQNTTRTEKVLKSSLCEILFIHIVSLFKKYKLNANATTTENTTTTENGNTTENTNTTENKIYNSFLDIKYVNDTNNYDNTYIEITYLNISNKKNKEELKKLLESIKYLNNNNGNYNKANYNKANYKDILNKKILSGILKLYKSDIKNFYNSDIVSLENTSQEGIQNGGELVTISIVLGVLWVVIHTLHAYINKTSR